MLILLPPSEGKADAGTGRRLDLARLSLPELNPAREEVLTALMALSAAGRSDGPGAETPLWPALGDTGQRGELARNARLRRAATAPAGQVYTGVLYEALDLATLPPGGPAGGPPLGAGQLRAVGRGTAHRPDPAVPVPDRGAAARRRGAAGVLAAGARRRR